MKGCQFSHVKWNHNNNVNSTLDEDCTRFNTYLMCFDMDG